MKEEDFMRLAIKKAKEGASKGAGGPFGAVITKKGKIISSACNNVLKDNDPTSHAEVNAIRIASKKLKTWNLSGCIIYSSCEPCPMCFSAIYWARIPKLYYSASLEEAAKGGFNEIKISNIELQKLTKTNVIIVPNFLEKEGKALFDWWGKKKDKKLY